MTPKISPRIFATLLLGIGSVIAQVPDAAPPGGAPAPASTPIGQTAPPGGGATKPAPASPFGQEIPVVDPGTEVMTFNGKNWNVTNNRIFQARFEKFLNAPEASSSEDVAYRQIVERILVLLAPGQATVQNVDAAFRLLPYAGRYDIDARLCNSLADAVFQRTDLQQMSEAQVASALQKAFNEIGRAHV